MENYSEFDGSFSDFSYINFRNKTRDCGCRPKAAQYRGGETSAAQGRIPEDWVEKPAKLRQKNRDARWTGKYSKAKPAADGAKRVDIAMPMFVYKSHVGIDRRHVLIRTWTATDAHHDGAQLLDLLDWVNTASEIWVDTAYRLAKNETHLAAVGFANRIRRRKPKGKPSGAATSRRSPANMPRARESPCATCAGTAWTSSRRRNPPAWPRTITRSGRTRSRN
jgi:hypothetical protein